MENEKYEDGFFGHPMENENTRMTLKNTFKEVLSGGWRYDLGKMIMR